MPAIVHPLNLARFSVALILVGFALLAMFGFALPAAIAFAVLFGAANGLMTIARGALPLSLFGYIGYGRVLGRIAKPFQIMQAFAPLALAFVVERAGDPVALSVTAAFAVASLMCLLLIRKPKLVQSADLVPLYDKHHAQRTVCRSMKQLVDIVLRRMSAVAGEFRAIDQIVETRGGRLRGIEIEAFDHAPDFHHPREMVLDHLQRRADL